MEECNHKNRQGYSVISDFSYFELDKTERTKHHYCHTCGTHWLRDEVWSAKAWYDWVNS